MGETRGSKVGRRIILPASFIGGPRDMRKRYMDAMALVQCFGKPDIFLTCIYLKYAHPIYICYGAFKAHVYSYAMVLSKHMYIYEVC